MKTIFPAGIVVACTVTLCGGAEGETGTLDPITVVASATEQDPFTDLRNPAPSLEIAIATIDSETITLQDARTLTEAVEFMPGVHTETRGRKLRQFTSVRGQIYPYPDYAINGMWMGKFDETPHFFPASQIEAVELVSSSAALLMGLSDLSGVINVIPRRYTEPTTIMELEGGTRGLLRASLNHGGATAGRYWAIGLNHMKVQGPTGGNAAENVDSFVGRGGMQVTDKVLAEGCLFYIRGMREWPVPNVGAEGYESSKQTPEKYDPFEQVFVGGRMLHKPRERLSTEISAYFAERSGEYYCPQAASASQRRGTDRDHEFSVGAMQAVGLSENNVLRVGLLYNHWVTPKGSHFFWNAPSDLHMFSAVIADEHQFADLLLDAAVRYVHTYNEQRSGRDFTVAGAIKKQAGIEDEWSDPMLTATLGATYPVGDRASLSAHLAIGSAEPVPGRETFDGSEIGNETRYMLDAGVKVEDNIGSAKLGVFYVRRDDATVFDGDAPNSKYEAYYENSGIEQFGLELESSSTPICGAVRLFLNGTVMESQRILEDGTTEAFVQIPDVIVGCGAYADLGKWDCNIFAKYVSGYENNRFNADGDYQRLGDYVDVNMTVGWSFGPEKRTRAYLAVKNLLDDRYSTVDGWEDYGTEFSFGASHRF